MLPARYIHIEPFEKKKHNIYNRDLLHNTHELNILIKYEVITREQEISTQDICIFL